MCKDLTIRKRKRNNFGVIHLTERRHLNKFAVCTCCNNLQYFNSIGIKYTSSLVNVSTKYFFNVIFDPFSGGNFKEIDSLIPQNNKARIGNTQCYR